MNQNHPIILKDGHIFSKGSFRLIGALIVVFVIGLAPVFIAGYIRISLVSGILILLLLGRKRVTILDPGSKSIEQHITIFKIPTPFTKTWIQPENISKVSLKYYSGNSIIVARRSYVPTRFDIKEFYVDLHIKNAKEAKRIRVLKTYKEALILGEFISKNWNLKFVDYKIIRDLKAKKAKLKRQKRGLK
ncbi:MAG: hypothetical protein ACPGD5_03570 [Salibacteraceae bacterium]